MFRLNQHAFEAFGPERSWTKALRITSRKRQRQHSASSQHRDQFFDSAKNVGKFSNDRVSSAAHHPRIDVLQCFFAP
jgi:hypothetical protein